MVTGHNLTQGTEAVATNASLIVYWDKPLNSLCVNAETVTLTSDSGDVIQGTVGYGYYDSRLRIFLNPVNNLAANTAYKLTLSGVCDLTGQVLDDYSLSFSTGDTVDTSRPSLRIQPNHRSTLVPIDSQISITFNELLDIERFKDSVSRGYIKVSSPLGNIAGNWVFDVVEGATRAVFTPLNALPGDSRIDVTLKYLSDQAGNYHDHDGGWRLYFSTAVGEDSSLPRVVSITPADGSMDIAPNSDVVLTFSESLSSNTVNNDNFMLYANGAIIKPDILRSADNRTVTLRGRWPQGAVVSVIATRAVSDLSGNALHKDYISLFTTGVVVADTPDKVRPRIVRQYPSNGASGVNANTEIVLYTSEPLNPDTVFDGFRVAENGVLIDGTLEVAGNNQSILFKPLQPFAEGALVHIYLDSTITDTVGHSLNNYQSSLRIGSTQTVGVSAAPCSL